MHVSEVPEIARMSTSEKILLTDEIWDSIGEDELGRWTPLIVTHEELLDVREEGPS